MKDVHKSTRVLAVVTLVLSSMCSHKPTAPAPSVYVYAPPQGFLPWPQHDPAYTASEYAFMMDQLYVINNFGQYQGGDTPETMYLHDGLDVVLLNGTKLFSIADGRVEAIVGTRESYRGIVISDSYTPGTAWLYAHTDTFSVAVGEYVQQGQQIARVSFPIGLGHVHLSRIRLREGGSWDTLSDFQYICPDEFFLFTDTEPPVIETPFHYFPNEGALEFNTGQPKEVSGDVDIVVGMRDQGEFARNADGYGDRLSVARIEFQILSNGEVVADEHSFDLRFKVIPREPYVKSEVAQTVYKFRYTVDPTPPESWTRIFSFYVLTNTLGEGTYTVIDPDGRASCWDTDELRGDGTRRFPNGLYVIAVAAYDYLGNHSVATDTVRVQNP